MRTLRQSLTGTVMLLLLGGLSSALLAQGTAGESPAPPIDGQTIAEMVNEAVASCGVEGCDQAIVEAAYGPDIRLTIDGQTMAAGLDELMGLLPAAGRMGNSYRLLTPVAEYRARDGDLFVALFVEVTGPGHPSGDPIVILMQVRNGTVIRQVDTTPPFEWAAK